MVLNTTMVKKMIHAHGKGISKDSIKILERKVALDIEKIIKATSGKMITGRDIMGG